MQYTYTGKKYFYDHCFNQFKALDYMLKDKICYLQLNEFIQSLNVPEETLSKKLFILCNNAAKEGDIVLYRYLINLDIPIDFNQSINPLYYAMKHYHEDMVTYLLEQPYTKQFMKENEFYSAILSDLGKYYDGLYIKLFCQYGFEPHKNFIQSLLEKTVEYSLNFEMLYFLELGANPHYQQERLFGIALDNNIDSMALEYFLKNNIFNIHSGNNYLNHYFNNILEHSLSYEESLLDYPILNKLPQLFNQYTPDLYVELHKFNNEELYNFFSNSLINAHLEKNMPIKHSSKKTKI